MTDRPLVIIHGWSDEYSSFKRLGSLLKERGIVNKIKAINLGNYISMDDEVSFEDIVTALSKAWERKKLPLEPFSVDVVVHSTGGLVIRDWISKKFQPNNVPIKHLIMLAPANFGSPLAHKGRTFMGRVIKGFKGKKMLQTGSKILKGLELASPYSWNLAFRDLFGNSNYYGSGKILCTVLVGDTGYTGISAAANEAGSDGTVRVSTANMNSAFLDIDFCKKNRFDPKYPMKNSKGKIAFGIMAGENHSTIAAKNRGPKKGVTLNYIERALKVDEPGVGDTFDKFCKNLIEHNKQVMIDGADDTYTHGYQNTVFFVQDQFGNHIDDYFLEFYVDGKDENWLTEKFQRDAIRKVHPYGDDKSYRSVYVDCTKLHEQIDKDYENLHFSLTASPEYINNGNVGYKTFTDDDIGNIKLSKKEVRKIFQANRTLLVRITIERFQSDEVFEFKTMNK